MGHLNTTIDTFHDQTFHAVQAREGHRSGVDAILLAAAVPPDTQGKVVDFGAGSGVAGMAVANRCSRATVDLVENDPVTAGLARMGIDLGANEHLADRMGVIEADITGDGVDRREAGLADDTYDVVIANPPFNDRGFRPSPNTLKAAAHMMEEDLLENWMRTAAAVSRPAGRLFMILRPQNMRELLDALAGRYGSITIKPVHAKANKPATRILISAQRSSKTPLRLLEPFVLHQESGAFTIEADIIFRGRAGFDLVSG
ncbi:MAG: tRNA1(Val) (adenine(37)-N6)-methyltransferase [Rhizobiaceae bacterium]